MVQNLCDLPENSLNNPYSFGTQAPTWLDTDAAENTSRTTEIPKPSDTIQIYVVQIV